MTRANKPPSNRRIPLLSTRLFRSTVEREIKLAIDDHFRLPELPASRFHDDG